MEVQLEEEYEDKQKVLRDKRELECKLLNTQEQVTSPRSPFFAFLEVVLSGRRIF